MWILLASSAIAVAALTVVIALRELAIVAAALAALGACAAMFHPLVKAWAYAALPSHPGVVNAASAVLAPIELAAPLALGVVAELFGAPAALVVLAGIPSVLFVVALRTR